MKMKQFFSYVSILFISLFTVISVPQKASAQSDFREEIPQNFHQHYREMSSNSVTEAEQTELEEQKALIEKIDKANSSKETLLRSSRTEKQNTAIDQNRQLFIGLSAGNKGDLECTTPKALERIETIEKLKKNIIRFEKYYPADSEEVQSLMSSLADYYSELESETYKTSTLSKDLILRGGEYDPVTESWPVTIYSEVAGRANVFTFHVNLSYKEIIKKNGSFPGIKSLEEKDDDANTMIADSLFRQAVPFVVAKLEYKIYHWEGASEYNFVPTKLTFCRLDKSKPIHESTAEEMSQKSFVTHPRLEIRSKTQQITEREESQKTIEEEAKGETFYQSAFGKQKKRRALYISTDTAIPTDGTFRREDLTVNSASLNVNFGINDYIYAGGGFSWEYRGKTKGSDYGIFANAGVNATLWGFLRPYLGMSTEFNTNIDGKLSLDTGVDFIISRVLLNLYYKHTWDYDFNNSRKPGVDRMSDYHIFGIGCGITW